MNRENAIRLKLVGNGRVRGQFTSCTRPWEKSETSLAAPCSIQLHSAASLCAAEALASDAVVVAVVDAAAIVVWTPFTTTVSVAKDSGARTRGAKVAPQSQFLEKGMPLLVNLINLI